MKWFTGDRWPQQHHEHWHHLHPRDWRAQHAWDERLRSQRDIRPVLQGEQRRLQESRHTQSDLHPLQPHAVPPLLHLQVHRRGIRFYILYIRFYKNGARKWRLLYSAWVSNLHLLTNLYLLIYFCLESYNYMVFLKPCRIFISLWVHHKGNDSLSQLLSANDILTDFSDTNPEVSSVGIRLPCNQKDFFGFRYGK